MLDILCISVVNWGPFISSISYVSPSVCILSSICELLLSLSELSSSKSLKQKLAVYYLVICLLNVWSYCSVYGILLNSVSTWPTLPLLSGLFLLLLLAKNYDIITLFDDTFGLIFIKDIWFSTFEDLCSDSLIWNYDTLISLWFCRYLWWWLLRRKSLIFALFDLFNWYFLYATGWSFC